MTQLQLLKISKRIDEIDALFDQELPDDVADNLERELEELTTTLEKSLRRAQFCELGLQVIKGGG